MSSGLKLLRLQHIFFQLASSIVEMVRYLRRKDEICLVLAQEQRRKAKEEKLEKLRKGEKVASKKRKPEERAASKTFYKQLIQDSDYVGEDYEVFSSWLGQTV